MLKQSKELAGVAIGLSVLINIIIAGYSLDGHLFYYMIVIFVLVT
jgi:hypothetical protein